MVMFSKYAPAYFPGEETLLNLYIPIHEKEKTPLLIHLRDNPPPFAWIEHDNCLFNGNKSHLDFIFTEKQYLQKHYQYFNEVRFNNFTLKISPNPIFKKTIRDRKGEIKGFTWNGSASGMDNTPRGRGFGGYRKILWVDAIAQQALSALYIARLYHLEGNLEEAQKWQTEYDLLKKRINENYWDPEDGFYYDIHINNGKFSKVKTPASLWPMLAEIPSAGQAARIVEHIENPEEFGGDFPWPSLSRDDKNYNHKTGDYWRGGIWLPMVYMGTKALKKYGYDSLADELAERVIYQQLRTYHAVEPNTIWECYSPSADSPSTEHGRQARPDFCGWSALGPISLFIENILGFKGGNAIENEIIWHLDPEKGTHGLKNLKFGQNVVDLVYEDGTVFSKAKFPFALEINGTSYSMEIGKNRFILETTKDYL